MVMSLLGFKEKIGHLVGTLSTGKVAPDNLHIGFIGTGTLMEYILSPQYLPIFSFSNKPMFFHTELFPHVTNL